MTALFSFRFFKLIFCLASICRGSALQHTSVYELRSGQGFYEALGAAFSTLSSFLGFNYSVLRFYFEQKNKTREVVQAYLGLVSRVFAYGAQRVRKCKNRTTGCTTKSLQGKNKVKRT